MLIFSWIYIYIYIYIYIRYIYIRYIYIYIRYIYIYLWRHFRYAFKLWKNICIVLDFRRWGWCWYCTGFLNALRIPYINESILFSPYIVLSDFVIFVIFNLFSAVIMFLKHGVLFAKINSRQLMFKPQFIEFF